MLNIIETTQPDLLHVQASGKLEEADIERLRPELARMAKAHGTFALLFDMRDFNGWTLKGMWEDFKTDNDYNQSVRKTAMVGDKQWQEWMTQLSAPFAEGEVKFFERGEMDEAHAWLQQADRDS